MYHSDSAVDRPGDERSAGAIWTFDLKNRDEEVAVTAGRLFSCVCSIWTLKLNRDEEVAVTAGRLFSCVCSIWTLKLNRDEEVAVTAGRLFSCVCSWAALGCRSSSTRLPLADRLAQAGASRRWVGG